MLDNVSAWRAWDVSSMAGATGLGPSARPLRRNGFTLIELLVVIAIISLLTGMLLPTLLRAKALAKRATCQGGLSNIGRAIALYQSDYGDYVPICWANIDPSFKHPWKSWRASLLPYMPFTGFNCPAAQDTGPMSEVLHSDDEVASQDGNRCTLVGSYGVLYQFSLDSYQTINYSGNVTRGHPVWSSSFSTAPGIAWRDPPNSVYIADGCLASGPVTYPSQSYGGYGTSAIEPPSTAGYWDVKVVRRRFADRHLGTNCLFLGGYVKSYETLELDRMVPGDGACVWSTQ